MKISNQFLELLTLIEEQDGSEVAQAVLAAQVDKRKGKGGRPSLCDDYEVWLFCQEHEGCSAEAVAAHFGVAPSSVYRKEGWKRRKDKEWM